MTGKTTAFASIEKATLLCLLTIAVLTFALFSPVVFDWFSGDDYVHLEWLAKLNSHPDQLLRNFYSNWLDIPTTKFYRPLISVSLAFDYLIWNQNAIGYHLTNITIHLLAALFLYGCTSELPSGKEKITNSVNWHAFFAATIFTVYPLHGETVCWITGRVDSIAVMFILASIWSYLRYQRLRSKVWLIASIVGAVLAFASKEIAITIPATIFLYEFTFSSQWQKSPRSAFVALKILKTSLRRALPFIIVTGIYLLVRRFSLGTFVGGYSDSILPADWHQAFANWKSGFNKLFLPINSELITQGNIFAKLLRSLIPTCAVLLVLRSIADKQILITAAFYCGWLFICFVPVMSIFSTAENLESSRMSYLMSAPLSGLLSLAAIGITLKVHDKKTRALGAVSFALAILLCMNYAAILYLNNTAWVQAGREVNAIKAAFKNLFAGQMSGRKWLVIDLPDNFKGAFVSRNALGSLLDHANQSVYLINKYSASMSVGRLKNLTQEEPVRCVRWSSNSFRFEDFALETTMQSPVKASLAAPGSKCQSQPLYLSDSTTFHCDYLVIKVHPQRFSQPPNGFFGNITSVFDGNEIPADAVFDNNLAEYVFPLRGYPAWTFGGDYKSGVVSFRDGQAVTPISAEIRTAGQMQPRLFLYIEKDNHSADHATFANPKDKARIKIDTSNLKNVKTAAIEISKQNRLFSKPNSHKRIAAETYKFIKHDSPNWTFAIDGSLTESAGSYFLRAWALDENGREIGQASDHISILRTYQ